MSSIIKYISFESIHYIINLDVVSSFMIFNDFDSIYVSMDIVMVSNILIFPIQLKTNIP